MAEKIEINGQVHIHTTLASKRLNVTRKRVLEFIAQGRINAVYMHGYYIPETELEKLRERRPGRPAATKTTGKKTRKKK